MKWEAVHAVSNFSPWRDKNPSILVYMMVSVNMQAYFSMQLLQHKNIIHNAVNPTNQQINKSTNQHTKSDLLNAQHTASEKLHAYKESTKELEPSTHSLIEGINYIVKTWRTTC